MRCMVEGARASMLAALAPLHHRLAAAVPLPVPGRSVKGCPSRPTGA